MERTGAVEEGRRAPEERGPGAAEEELRLSQGAQGSAVAEEHEFGVAPEELSRRSTGPWRTVGQEQRRKSSPWHRGKGVPPTGSLHSVRGQGPSCSHRRTGGRSCVAREDVEGGGAATEEEGREEETLPGRRACWIIIGLGSFND